MSQAGNSGRLTIRVQIEGIAEAETKLKALQTTIDSMGTKLTATASSMSKLPQSLNSLKSAADSTATSLQKLPTALNAINANSGVAAIDRLKTSVTGLGGTLNTAASNVQQFSSRVQASMQSISTGGGLTSVKTAVTGLNSTFNSGIPTIQRYGTTLTSLGTSASATSGGLNTMKSGLDSLSTSSEKAGRSAGSMTQQYASMGGRIGGVALSTVILTSAIDEAVGMQGALEQSQQRVTNAQNAYNAAVAQYGPSSQEAVRAQQSLEKAQNALTFATRNAGFAWRDIIPIAGLMVTQAIEPMIQGFTRLNAASAAAGGFANLFKGGLGTAAGGIVSAMQSLASAFTPITTQSSAAVKGLDAVSSAMEGTAQKASLLRTSIGGLTFAGFLGIVGAVAAALLALATNVGGSRDAMNKLGQDVAKAVPQMEGLLNFFGKAIEGLGQLMGVQSEADKLWVANATKIAEANKLIETSMKGPFEAFQAFTDLVEQQGQLKPLDQFFGGSATGGLGQVLADLEQITFVFDNMATATDPLIDTLQPVINSLTRMKEEVTAFGGETLNRYNEAWEFANQLMERAMNEGIEPTSAELGKLRNMVNQVGSTINTDLIDPFEAAIQSGEKWQVTGNLIQRNLEDTGGQMATLGNLTHVTGETFMTESGNLVTFEKGLTKVAETSEDADEKLGTLTTALGDTNTALIEHINQTNELVGTDENATNAILKVADSLAQHKVNIDQLNETLGTSEGQLLSFQNAVAAGDEKFLKWVQDTRDAAVEAQTFEGNLQNMANTLGGLPGFMEGTIAEYQGFIEANEQGGEAAKKFEEQAIASWEGLVSGSKPLFEDLKGAWREVFEGTTLENAQSAIEKVNEKIRSNVEHNNGEIEKANKKMGENIQHNWEATGNAMEGSTGESSGKIVDIMEGVAPQIKDVFEGVDWGELSDAMADPFMEAFNKLPMMVSDTLDQTERNALVLEAKFATISENAATVFGTNLKAGVAQGLDFTEAVPLANQAVLDMLAPFVAEHPQLAGMFSELTTAMQQQPKDAARSVQDILEKYSGLVGPAGDVAADMLEAYRNEYGGKLPGVTKTGVEGAIQELGGLQQGASDKMVQAIQSLQRTMFEMGKKITKAIKDAINSDEIKQDENKVPDIKVNTNPANTAIQLIAKSIADLQTFLEEPEQLITLHTSNVNPVEGQVQLIGTAIADIKEFLAQEENMISLVASETNPLDPQVQSIGTVIPQVMALLSQPENLISLVASETNPLEGQVTSVTTMPDQVNQFMQQNPITMIAANTNPLAGQITLVTNAPNQVNQNLRQNTISMVATNENPLAGQIRLATEAPGDVNQNLQQNPIQMVGANINPLEAQVQNAFNAHQQLQTWLDQNPIRMTGAQGGGAVGGYGGAPTGQRGAYGGPGYASGFGPAIVSKPTMMLVGEAGPELVSVTPEKGLKFSGDMPFVRAQAGFGQQYQFGQNYGYNGQGLFQNDAEEEAYKREVQSAMQQGTQQGMEQSYPGMQDAVQQGAMEGTQQGMEQGMGQGGGGYGGYQEAPSQIQAMLQGGMSPQQLLQGFGQGRGFTWGGGAQGTSITPGGGGGAQYPMAPSNTEIFGAGRFNWTGGAQGTNIGMPGMMGGNMYPQIQYGEAQAEAISQGFQQGMNNQQQIWVNQGLKAGQSMGTGTLMGFQDFMRGQQGTFNQMPAQIFKGFPAGAAQFGGLMGEAMMVRFNQELQDTIAKGPAELYDQFGRSLQAATGGAGGAGGPSNVQPSNVPAYTGSQIPKGVTTSQTINGVRATVLPGQYIGTGTWPPTQPGAGGGGGGGGGGLPPPSGGGGGGGMPGGGGAGGQPGYPVAPSNTEIWGQMPITYKWYGPGDARNTVSAGGGGSGAIPGGGGIGGGGSSPPIYVGSGITVPPRIGAQGGFHGVVDRAMTLAVHPNERVDVSPGPRGGGHGEGCQHIHIYIGNEKIKELVRNTAGTQMDRFIR